MQLLERNYAENMSIQTWKELQLGLSVSNLAKYDLRIVGSRIERVTNQIAIPPQTAARGRTGGAGARRRGGAARGNLGDNARLAILGK